jgi:MYXO-CTERM domain-containing protein
VRRTLALGTKVLVALCGLSLAGPARADNLVSGAPNDLFAINDGFITGLNTPTSMAFLPDGRIVVTEKGGLEAGAANVKLYEANGSYIGIAGTFSVSNLHMEQGLLKVLVHPDFASNRLLIFYYSRSDGTEVNRNRVVTVPLGTDNQLQMGSMQVLLEGIYGPENHNGGGMSIGPDGNLYIGVGDTGCNNTGSFDNWSGTCLSNLNGKILRIGLDGSIPSSNPLVGVAAATTCNGFCPTVSGSEHTCCNGPRPTGDGSVSAPRTEIFAWGFRNPWRLWVDPTTGFVWVADVGDFGADEIDVIKPDQPARHYGWPMREGTSGEPPDTCTQTRPNTGNCVDPIYNCTYASNPGIATCKTVVGGFIVDDCTWPEAYRNRYFFADYSYGDVWSIPVNATRDGMAGTREDFAVSRIDAGPVDLAFGPDGGLYYVVIAGYVVQVKPKALSVCPPMPDGGAGAGAGGVVGTGGAAVGAGGATSGGGGVGVGGAATGGSTGGAVSSGGSSGGGSVVYPRRAVTTESGCGCRIAGGPDGAALALSALAGLGVLGALRRRRRSETR